MKCADTTLHDFEDSEGYRFVTGEFRGYIENGRRGQNRVVRPLPLDRQIQQLNESYLICFARFWPEWQPQVARDPGRAK